MDFIKFYTPFFMMATKVDFKLLFNSFFDLDKILKYLGTIKYDDYLNFRIFVAPFK
jgi:hypothetical protein